MTISQSIIKFIKGYDAKLGKTDTDILATVVQSFALVKTPREDIQRYVDGSIGEITTSYDILCRLPCQSEADRIKNQDWFEKFAEWLRKQDREGNLPELDDATCTQISISISYAMQQFDKQNATYSMTIAIKREEN